MNNITLPDPSLDLAKRAYCQLVHNLTTRLPPPLADTPEALITRNQTAIAQVIALLPVNANETGLATQCVATRAQAEDMLRLIREHAGDDIRVVIKLNAQYAAMVRASLGAHGHLQRAQAIRHKREQNNAACTADEWTQHIAAEWIQQALGAGPPLAARQAAPAAEASPPPEPDPIQAAQPPSPVPPAAPPPALVAAPAVPPVSAPAAPPPVLTAAPSPEFAAVAAAPHAPAAPVPAEAPRRSRHPATQASPRADDPPRNLPTEADHYAIVYPYRAREIRHYGGLPPNCTYGPPDDDLVHAIVTGTTPDRHHAGPASARRSERRRRAGLTSPPDGQHRTEQRCAPGRRSSAVKSPAIAPRSCRPSAYLGESRSRHPRPCRTREGKPWTSARTCHRARDPMAATTGCHRRRPTPALVRHSKDICISDPPTSRQPIQPPPQPLGRHMRRNLKPHETRRQ